MILHGSYEVVNPENGAVLIVGLAKEVRAWATEYLRENPSVVIHFRPVTVHPKRHWWQKETITRDTDRMGHIGFIPKSGKEFLALTEDQYRQWYRLEVGTELISLNNEDPYARKVTFQGLFAFPQGDVFPLVTFADGSSGISLATLLIPTKHTLELLDNPEYASQVWDIHMMLTSTKI
jgi:hypothetical protein